MLTRLELGMAGNFELIKCQNFERPLQISLKTNGSKNKQFLIRNITCCHTKNYNEDGTSEKDEDNQSRRSSSQDIYPSLQPENVVSILVSASFLKMEPLVTVGLRYVHSNMNKILSATHNINCLGEPLLSR